ncbi:MAG: hypothetical protein FVQ79_02215 [Planctomycetes bacterium]|nr:hypothetical protein [Planctomycetota bacterium]
MEEIKIIIPARLASTRFPGKVLADLNGQPVIQWVYEGSKYDGIEINVATPDKEIADTVEGFGGEAILTPEFPTLMDRCSWAAKEIKLIHPNVAEFIIVQGDEPMVRPAMINLIVKAKGNSCLVGKISAKENSRDPNMVKILVDKYMQIMYTSRLPLPGRTPENEKLNPKPITYKQVCIMKFSSFHMLGYGKLQQTEIEKSEGIDIIRCLENGWLINGVVSPYITQAVDVPEDLERVKELLS